VFALVGLVLGVGLIGVIVFSGNEPRLAAAPTPTPAATPAITAAPSPTPALAVTGDGPGGDPADATPEPDRPTPAPLATAGASRDPGTATARDLGIEFPQEGDVVVSRRINVFGRAGGGARVVRDLLDGSTADTVARPDGLWVMGVDLDPGENELTFRVDGSDAPPVVVHVTYEPR
jgi:hypothetical protein